jgi:hypothetical protein
MNSQTKGMRTIEATQKNAFTLIAKYLRDQGVPIRTRRDLVEYTDVGNIRNALLYWTDAYNQDVMNERKKNAKAKREARSAKQLLQSKNFQEIQQSQNAMGYDNTITNIKNAFRSRAGRTVILQFGGLNQQQVFVVPVTGFNQWFDDNVHPFCQLDSAKYKWEDNVIQIYLYDGTEVITPSKIQQAFQEGTVNCVIKPMLDWAESCLENASGRSSKFEYTKIIRELTEMAETFKLGVTEPDLHIIVSRVPVDITITKPLSNETLCTVKCSKKARKHFKFINVRLNHVEQYVNTGIVEHKTRTELLEVQKALDESKTYYTYTKDGINIRSISTPDCTYSLSNEYFELCTEWETAVGLDVCYLDDVKQKDLSQFVRSGVHYNGTIDFQCSDAWNVNSEAFVKMPHHIDMEKAYIQYKKCKNYAGFPGKLVEFRQTNKIEGIGYYQIQNVVIHNPELNKLNQIMQFYFNAIYPSSELEFLAKHATFEIVAGTWAIETLDFDMTESFFMQKYDGVTGYAKYIGCCSRNDPRKRIWMRGDKTMAQLVQQSDGKLEKFANGEICLSFEKGYNYHLSALTGFITSYQRIQVLEQLMTIEYDNLIRVCVDGIYTKTKVQFAFPFREKPDEIHFGNAPTDMYITHSAYEGMIPEPREFHPYELHRGAGGTGKTHKNLKDTGLVKLCYVAISHKLTTNKRLEYGIQTDVLANLLSRDPKKISDIKKKANSLLIDECSMMTEFQKNYILQTYSDCKIIFCGDVGYQAPPWEGEEMNADALHCVDYTKNYRCTCPILATVLWNLRSLINEQCHAGMTDSMANEYIQKQFPIVTEDELKQRYKVDDMILAHTNVVKDKYKDMFPYDKWYVTVNTREYCNGQIVIGAKPDTTCEKRHCFTVHSIQGETAHSNLYINLEKKMPIRLLYTALSRARTASQIFILK